MKRILLFFCLAVIGMMQAFAQDDRTCSVLPMGDVGRWEAKYFHPTPEQQPDENWFAADFDDSAWGTLQGPISTEDCGPIPEYASAGYFIWPECDYDSYCIRRYFTLSKKYKDANFIFKIRHDDGVLVYINGQQYDGEWGSEIPVFYFKEGQNVIAVKIENTGGPGLLDFGIDSDINQLNEIVMVNVPVAGTLWESLSNAGLSDLQISQILKLKVSGMLNKDDFTFIRSLMPKLRYLDISAVKLTELPENAFNQHKNLRTCILPEALKQINHNAFSACEKLWKVCFGNDDENYEGGITFPMSIVRVGDGSFEYCRALTGVLDFRACTSLEYVSGYNGCDRLTSIVFPEEGNITLGWYGLHGGFQEINLSASVSRIDGCNFSSNLRVLNVQTTKVISCQNEAFDDAVNNIDLVVNIPIGTRKAFALAEGWSKVYMKMQEYGYQVKFDGQKGKVSYDTKQLVNDEIIFHNEAAVTLNVEPVYGYQLSGATLDNEPIEVSENSVVLPAGVKGGTIRLSFVPVKYDLTVNITGNGSVIYNDAPLTSPAVVPVEYSTQATFAIQPEEGYVVKSIKYNGEESVIQNGGLSYTTPVCAGEATMDVEFVGTGELQNTVSFTVKSDDNGIVSYNGVVLYAPEATIRLDKGGYATFSIRAKNGYYINDIIYNGTSVKSELQNGELTLTGIDADAVLEVICSSASDVEVSNPNGNLAQAIADKGINIKTISSLKLTGNVTDGDFAVMKSIAALQHVDLSETTLISIPNEAFLEKSSLVSIALPATLTFFGERAFQGCTSLAEVTGFENVQIIRASAFQNCVSLINLPFGNNIQEIWNNAFDGALSNAVTFDEIVFPVCFRHLGSAAFVNWGSPVAKILSVDMSKCTFSENDILTYCLFSGRGLKNIKLPEKGNYRLSYLTLNGCNELKELVIPNAVSVIDGNPLPEALEKLYVQSRTPLHCGSDAFGNIKQETCTLYVPMGALEDYQYASYWSNFSNIVEYGYQILSNDFGHVRINGSDCYNGDNYFPIDNETVSFEFVPETNYHVEMVTFNDEVVTLNADGTYTVPAGVTLGTLNVKFAPDKFNIDIVKTGNGKILFNNYDYANGTKVPVEYNSFAEFTLVPDGGYVVKYVAYNDKESVVQNGGTTFVTPIIKDNAKFAVEFAESSAITDVVSFEVITGENGTVEYKNTTLLPVTSIFVKTSEPAEFKLIPSTHYNINKVLLNDEDVTAEVADNVLTIAKDKLKESTLQVTFTYDTDITVDVATAGTLDKLISDPLKQIVRKLTITGTLNDNDFSTIKNTMPNVEVLDLSGITNVYLPWQAFTKDINNWGGEIGMTSLKEVKLPAGLYEISDGAFAGCRNLEKVNFEELTELYNIGHRAFSSTALKDVDLSKTKITELTNCQFRFATLIEHFIFPTGLTRIGEQFENSKLTSVDMSGCTKLESIDRTFNSCIQLTEIKLPESLKSIGNDAFRNCKAMESITIPANVESIGACAFADIYIDVYMDGTVPPSLNFNVQNEWESIFTDATLIFVPNESIVTYRQAPSWEKYANQIVSKDATTELAVVVEAHPLTSSVRTEVLKQLGFEDIKTGTDIEDATYSDADADYALTNVTSLKVTGTINSYDIMIMRNKMVALRKLDLSEASIVANDYAYYEGYHTEDDILGPKAFANLKLTYVNLPASIKEIGDEAFWRNRALRTVIFHEGLEVIGSSAFNECSSINSIDIPASVSSIGGGAFWQNNNMRTLAFAKNSALREIEGSTFYGCSSLQELNLPYKITRIGGTAFSGCNSLTEIHIPTMVERIEDDAFTNCRNLKKVFAATIEPITINQRAFDCWTTATLYIPDFNTSYYKYYWDTQWSQFIYAKERYHQDYEEFYINEDYTLEEEDERIVGPGETNPSGEFNSGSGFIVEGGEQEMNEITVKSDGKDAASIIVDGGLNAEILNVKINIEGGRWYFFCFPFDLQSPDDVSCNENAQYVFRHYDGASRATNGSTGWKEITPEAGSYLKAGKGYIFQSDRNCVMSITIKNPVFVSQVDNQTLDINESKNAQDANWNFVGNPYLSYFNMSELEKTGFTSPVTIWNGESYEAISPTDDEYHFYPFQAFFVQKPDDMEDLVFNKDGRETKTQAETTAASNAKVRMAARSSNRKLINLTITDGQSSDKTRVVFNEEKSMNYEMGCDAAKFFSSENVPQLYSLDNKKVLYSINERPVSDGTVALGFIANSNGEYTIAQTRMDTPVVLYDAETGITHDLSEGGYTFFADKGTYNSRFILKADGATSIEGVDGKLDGSSENVYNLNGIRIDRPANGVNIINGKKVLIK